MRNYVTRSKFTTKRLLRETLAPSCCLHDWESYSFQLCCFRNLSTIKNFQLPFQNIPMNKWLWKSNEPRSLFIKNEPIEINLIEKASTPLPWYVDIMRGSFPNASFVNCTQKHSDIYQAKFHTYSWTEVIIVRDFLSNNFKFIFRKVNC